MAKFVPNICKKMKVYYLLAALLSSAVAGPTEPVDITDIHERAYPEAGHPDRDVCKDGVITPVLLTKAGVQDPLKLLGTIGKNARYISDIKNVVNSYLYGNVDQLGIAIENGDWKKILAYVERHCNPCDGAILYGTAQCEAAKATDGNWNSYTVSIIFHAFPRSWLFLLLLTRQ